MLLSFHSVKQAPDVCMRVRILCVLPSGTKSTSFCYVFHSPSDRCYMLLHYVAGTDSRHT